MDAIGQMGYVFHKHHRLIRFFWLYIPHTATVPCESLSAFMLRNVSVTFVGYIPCWIWVCLRSYEERLLHLPTSQECQ